MIRLALLLLVAASALAQEAASVSGTVRDGADQPLPGITVRFRGPQRAEATTNAQGRYELEDLQPGRYRMTAYQPPMGVRKYVALAPGQHAENVDLRIEQPAEVRGRVVDDNGEPIAGAWVHLVGTEYRYGLLRHTFRDAARTDDLGEYSLRRARPNQRYAVLAKLTPDSYPAISDAPWDPRARRPAFQPTYYPRSADMIGAERLILRSGEVREGIDIQMRRSESYCVSGVLQLAGASAPLRFEFTELQPSSGLYADGGMYTRIPFGKTGPDGRFRICDLAPGEYRLTSRTDFETQGLANAAIDVTIVDRDIEGLTAPAAPVFDVPVEITWAGEGPAETTDDEIIVSISAVFRTTHRHERHNQRHRVPSEYVHKSLAMDSYEVRVLGLPDGWYLADIQYAGRSILGEMLRLGSAPPDAKLRVLIGHDGSRIVASVEDDDHDPVTDAYVYVLPEPAKTAEQLAAAMSVGQTDQLGRFESDALKPGTYRLVALREDLDLSPESIRRLLAARAAAEKIEVPPNETAEVSIEIETSAR